MCEAWVKGCSDSHQLSKWISMQIVRGWGGWGGGVQTWYVASIAVQNTFMRMGISATRWQMLKQEGKNFIQSKTIAKYSCESARCDEEEQTKWKKKKKYNLGNKCFGFEFAWLESPPRVRKASGWAVCCSLMCSSFSASLLLLMLELGWV